MTDHENAIFMLRGAPRGMRIFTRPSNPGAILLPLFHDRTLFCYRTLRPGRSATFTQLSLSSRPLPFPSLLCLGNQIKETGKLVRRGLTEERLPGIRRKDLPEKALHGEETLPATDRPDAGQFPPFPAAVGKGKLMPELGAADFPVVISFYIPHVLSSPRIF